MQLYFKGGHDHKFKESTSDIHRFLQHVETKFSDMLISANQIVMQQYIGKGMYIVMYLMYNIITL